MEMAGRLDGKVALISGTGTGQGRAAGVLFASEGARVVGCDLKTEESEQTVAMVKEAGGEMVSLHPLDLGDEQQAKRWIDFAVETYGDFDILYNNASAPRFGRVTEMSAEDWHFTLRNELDVVFYPTKYAVPVMARKGGGSIINTASVAGVIGLNIEDLFYEFAHSATKGGVIATTRTLAAELAPQNIRVNSISPGGIETPAWDVLGNVVEALKDNLLKIQMIKRTGRPEDIAYCALYLASDESSFVTGQNFIIDGGATAW